MESGFFIAWAAHSMQPSRMDVANYLRKAMGIAAAISLLSGCSGPTPTKRPVTDTRGVINIVAQTKYYLSDIPPRLIWAELYGEEAAVGTYGNTNVHGVVFEIVEPAQYAGKVYTLRHTGHPAKGSFAIGELYEFRATVREIGEFSFKEGAPSRVRKLALEEANKKLTVHSGPRMDDLEWLVGRWRCITREWTTPTGEGPLGYEDTLDYFNVYFPYADDHLTLTLTDHPRPIAAEFLARRVSLSRVKKFEEALEFKECLGPMMPWGGVAISKDSIVVGASSFERIAFRYATRVGRSGPLLILESDMMRLELYKITEKLDDIKHSSVIAPIKDYTPEQISELKKKYDEMVRAHREATEVERFKQDPAGRN